MKIELLIRKTEDEFVNTAEAFRNLLMTRSALRAAPARIYAEGVSALFRVDTGLSVDRRNRWFHVTVESDAEYKIHRAGILSKIQNALTDTLARSGRVFFVQVIRNDVRRHFAEKATPAILRADALLRTFTARFLLQAFGDAWLSDALAPTGGEPSSGETAAVTQETLRAARFSDLLEFFFTPQHPIDNTEALRESLRRREIPESWNRYFPISLWEHYFEDIVAYPEGRADSAALCRYKSEIDAGEGLTEAGFAEIKRLSARLGDRLHKALERLDEVRVSREDLPWLKIATGGTVEKEIRRRLAAAAASRYGVATEGISRTSPLDDDSARAGFPVSPSGRHPAKRTATAPGLILLDDSPPGRKRR